MIVFYIMESIFALLLCGIFGSNALRWFNTALTDKINNYPFDRYYGLFLCTTFAYALMSMVMDFSERFVIVVNYFVG
jgi:hypothetical protein